ncbi:hypothetical protein ACIBK8_19000 [Streptomyces sp. NPDC050161]|uniref:hypothetical protein n=1 Tax=Streptomyces sp. NPDC050161 TaxID=3365604 RepID=UPI0037BDFD43
MPWPCRPEDSRHLLRYSHRHRHRHRNYCFPGGRPTPRPPPCLTISLMRGNLDSRIAQCDAPDAIPRLDALVVSYAGAQRIGLADRAADNLPPTPSCRHRCRVRVRRTPRR